MKRSDSRPTYRPLFVAVLMTLAWNISACKTTETTVEANTPKPAHHTHDGFRNQYYEAIEKSPWTLIKMKYFGEEEFADHEAEAHRVPIAAPAFAHLLSPTVAPQVTWLGHSTFLIQYRGLNILTDPILSNRASPVSFAGPARLVDLSIKMKHLPRIDYVVISHNHYDHLDQETIEALGNTPRYLVPLRLKEWFLDEGIDVSRVDEFDWWDQRHFDNLTITATPSQHWSARGLFDRNKTLWAAWHLRIDDFTV